MKSFDGAVAVVTGGAGEIGRAIGRSLVGVGATVVVADIDTARTVAAASDIGGDANPETVDVTNSDQVHRLVERVLQRHGRLDVWCNNAGTGLAAPVERLPHEAWRQMIDVNIWGTVLGIEAAYPIFVRQRSGHLVNIASLGGVTPVPLLAAYSMTKHAVVGLSTSLAIEARRHGVSVHTICPGPVESPLLDAEPPPGVEGADAVDVRRYLTSLAGPPCSPDDVAAEVLHAIERDKSLSVVPGRSKMVWRAQRFTPGIAARVARRAARRELGKVRQHHRTDPP